jgi:hypothetical protein
MAGPYDIFVNIWQSNNFSSYGYDAARDVGHTRIFGMAKGPGVGVITQVTGEPLSYQGAATVDPALGPPVGHILAFCRDYYLPNRLTSGRNILIIPNAQGGTGFSNGVWGIVAGVGRPGHEDTITRVNAAMAANPGSVIKACFCQGGEEDGFWVPAVKPDGTPGSYVSGQPQAFIDYTKAEVADFRARWTGGTNVPFLFGQMSPNYWQPEPKYPAWTSEPWYLATPRYCEYAPGYKTGSLLAIEQMATHVPNSVSIPSLGLTTKNWDLRPSPVHEDVYQAYEYIHYDAESQRGSATQTNPLSKRYWAGFQTLDAGSDTWTEARVRIGTGGWTVGGCASTDGSTLCAWADVYGAYIYNDTSGEWENVLVADRLPSSIVRIGNVSLGGDPVAGGGPIGVAVAPSDPNRIYVLASCNENNTGWSVRVLKSVNRGLTFTLTTSFAPGSKGGGNSIGRMYGPKIAADPANPDWVLIGLQNLGGAADGGTFLTKDGGATWLDMNARGVPKPLTTGDPQKHVMTGILFDNAVVSGGHSTTMYAYSGGNGLYRSTDSGDTWTLFHNATTIPHVSDMQRSAADGTIYLAGNHDYIPGPAGKMGWKIVGGVLSALTVDVNCICLMPHPTAANRVVAMDARGAVNISYNAGGAWEGWSITGTGGAVLSSPDIPWLALSAGADYQSTHRAIIDPSTGKARSGRVIIFGGNGITWSDSVVPASGVHSASATFRTKGIECLCATMAQHPPGGRFLLTVQDRRCFVRGDDELQIYPAKHAAARWQVEAIVYGTDCTWAKGNPNFLVFTGGYKDELNTDDDAYSLDGGVTWAQWPTRPAIGATYPYFINGCMAAATDQNVIWWPTNRRPPYYTKNRGASWQLLNVGGDSGDGDWIYDTIWAGYLRRRIVDADNVNIGTYLLYILGSSNATAIAKAGLWLSNNLGDTWTKIYSGAIYPFQFHVKLKHVNGVGGAYVMTDGDQDGLAGGLYKIQVAGGGVGTGAPTITAYPGVVRCVDFAIGKLMPGKTWPRLWFLGWLDPADVSTAVSAPEAFGVYYTDDADQTDPAWTKVTEGNPAGHLDGAVSLAASPDYADLAVIGYASSGFVQISKGVATAPASGATYFRPYRQAGRL